MPRKKKADAPVYENYEIQPGSAERAAEMNTAGRISLGDLLSDTKQTLVHFDVWLVGITPLICHAWSQKAKMEMLKKQTRATRLALGERDPDQDFKDSLYEMEKGVFGFPITAFKSAIISSAHVKRGVAKTDVQAALWLDAEQVQTRPALPGARCDMPLVRVYGSPPEMREDMVRIGSGLRKVANLAYRAQFTTWACKLTGSIVDDLVPARSLAFLLRQAGTATGVGDWRNEKKGWFGAFRIAEPAEAEQWNAFAAGTGPLPGQEQQSKRKKAA